MPEPFSDPDAAMLLAEQHHRTRNLFQLTDAVLNNAARTVPGAASVALREVQVQLAAFAKLNDMLYPVDGTLCERLCCAQYLKAIVALLRTSCLAPRGIALTGSWPRSLPVRPSICRHLGLILTELVFNAAKHAFPDGGGRVHLSLMLVDHQLRLKVADDGVGVAHATARKDAQGSSFLAAIARAMGATLDRRSSEEGTVYTVDVPVDAGRRGDRGTR